MNEDCPRDKGGSKFDSRDSCRNLNSEVEPWSDRRCRLFPKVAIIGDNTE